MTAAELMRWAEKRRWGARRRADVEETLQIFAILPPDMEACRRWADIRTARERAGRPISVQDAWIAAIALRFDIPPATNNERDFEGITNLEVVHPR